MLGGSCSSCCGSCPDFSVLAAAPTVEVEFSWEKSFYQTYDPWTSSAVDWYRLASVPRQTVSLSFWVSQGLYSASVPYQVNVSNWSGTFIANETRGLVVWLQHYTDHTRPNIVLSMMSLSWVLGIGSAYDYIHIEDIPCAFGGGVYGVPNQLCGRQLLFEWSRDGIPSGWSTGPYVDVGVPWSTTSVSCIDGGQTAISVQDTQARGGALDFRVRNAVVPPSSDCSRNSGFLPPQSPGVRQFSYAWTKTVPSGNPFQEYAGRGGESLAVHAVNAVFGDTRINLLSSSLETNWEKVTARSRSGSGWTDF